MKLKNNRGVTLTALTVAVIIILILTSTILYKSKNKIVMEKYDNLLIDIDAISAKIDEYYEKNNEIPIICSYINKEDLNSLLQKVATDRKCTSAKNNNSILNPNDSDKYYVINLEKLDGLTLNFGYGSEYKNIKSSGNLSSNNIEDVETKIYIINEATHQIYYPYGVILDGLLYYTNEFSQEVTEEQFDPDKFNKKTEDEIGKIVSPKLAAGMIPVVYDENNKKWKRTTEDDEQWYNYDEKKWANVVLSEATFDDDGYLSEYTESGTAISYTMLVWLPRYAYRITSKLHYSSGSAGDISIKFITTDNKDQDGIEYSTSYPSVVNSGEKTGSMNDYVVHPAFEYGTEHLSGFWIGKFETGIDGQTGGVGANSWTEYNGTDKQLKIAGGQNAWRNITIKNAMTVCQDMNNNEIYGLSSDDSIVDPHLIKNSEWGAVAYLSDSIYGIQQGESDTGRNIGSYINTSQYYITGASSTAVSEGAELSWKDVDGYKASTTGTIYGVYDMSGGAHEFVAAFLESNTNYTSVESKYKDVYKIDGNGRNEQSNYEANKDRFGDAMYEVSNTTDDTAWNTDETSFMFDTYPLLTRGGSYNNTQSSGIFASFYSTDENIKTTGFRLTIAVLK